MFNNEIFTSPEKCISECDKQINFARQLTIYLEQYIAQLETMKSMAQSAKVFQEVNPFNLMMQFVESINNAKPANLSASNSTKTKNEQKDDECE